MFQAWSFRFIKIQFIRRKGGITKFRKELHFKLVLPDIWL
jgi:hypothetical protein